MEPGFGPLLPITPFWTFRGFLTEVDVVSHVFCFLQSDPSSVPQLAWQFVPVQKTVNPILAFCKGDTVHFLLVSAQLHQMSMDCESMYFCYVIPVFLCCPSLIQWFSTLFEFWTLTDMCRNQFLSVNDGTIIKTTIATFHYLFLLLLSFYRILSVPVEF